MDLEIKQHDPRKDPVVKKRIIITALILGSVAIAGLYLPFKYVTAG